MGSAIKLFAVGTGWGIPFVTGAPFPLKLATWMRMANIPYEVVTENNTGKGPKKKTPWIEDGEVRMGDSQLIIEYLAKKHGKDLDAGLSAEQRGLTIAIRRMFEEHYHQAFEHQLFFGRGGEQRTVEMLSSMPAIARPLVKAMFTGALKKQLYARGVSRHGEETLIEMGKADLDAASALLGDKKYFLGDEPHTVDACAFGFLATSIYVAGDNPLFNHGAAKENLAAYCERMRARYFPETLEKLMKEAS
jgi:glutathione S-transferase